MPTSIYKSLNIGDLERTAMTIQLANRSIVQLLGVLEDVLVQVIDLIFLVDFYVLDMEDETSRKGSTLILGQPFLMSAGTKIDVHAGTLLMEFGDNLVQFIIFEARKHPTKDPSLFGIDVINGLVAEYMQSEVGNAEFSNFAEDIDVIGCLQSISDESDYDKLLEVQDLPDFEDDTTDFANLDLNSEMVDLIDQAEFDYINHLGIESNSGNLSQKQQKAKINSANPMLNLDRVANEASPLHLPPKELKSLLSHLKYAYLDNDQQFLYKKAIGWRLSDLLGINPSIYMHKILMEEEARPIRQHLVQVVPKKFGMTVMKNQHGELVPMRIQNSWRVYINYRKLNQVTCKDHIPLPFIDQVLEKLAGKSHYYFLDGFFGYMQIHIASED
ncbi:hypothetical protein CR513_15833, partial [Mucuna pruriens]